MSAYARSAEIIRRLKLEMPVEVTLPDVISSKPFSIRRDNVLALLTIDTANLLVEGQSVAAFYVEMGRAQRAAELAAAKAEIIYRKWKADQSSRFRISRSEKKPTKDECEENYRTNPAYEEMASASEKFKALAGLFDDIKRGFDIKGRVVHDQTTMVLGHERATRADDDFDRLSEMESIEEEVAQMMSKSEPAHSRKPRAL
jgi:hypothetical protein